MHLLVSIAMSDRLVDDILDLVFAWLHPKEWRRSWPQTMLAKDLRKDLATCSLVSKRWRAMARPHLFRDIVYTFRAVPEERTTAVEGEPYLTEPRYRTLRMFHTFLQQNNFACTAIRRLQLRALPATANDGTVMSMFYKIPDFVYGPQDMVQVELFMDILALTYNISDLDLREIILALPRPTSLSGLSLQTLEIYFGTAQTHEDWKIQPDYATTKILSCFDLIDELGVNGLIIKGGAAMPPAADAPDLSHLRVRSLHLGHLMGAGQRGIIPQSLQEPLFAQSLRVLDFTTTDDEQLPVQQELLEFVQDHIQELICTVDNGPNTDTPLIIPHCPNLRSIRLGTSIHTCAVGEDSDSHHSINRLVLYLRQCRRTVSFYPALARIVLHLGIVSGRKQEPDVWLVGLTSALKDLDSALVEFFDCRPSCALTIEYGRPRNMDMAYATTALVHAFARFLPKMVGRRGLTFCVAGQYLREYEHQQNSSGSVLI
ncbi:hypothetical protein PHLGIDRAFT_271568 [Phlebiopsis gigantea 11061_1 CR5-6]|uniref:F-box domain-containing protein n=1 Tax=Phlebiopsis gigantea (strain 11061_1 CR5-6) TaxID=745531 RepID=A0A0C3RRV4_PHLG1|nr:hypothetical protein PHLGIDRAFT_271568 [Phlebiopsis gigantea 11061_1 CR5-6]